MVDVDASVIDVRTSEDDILLAYSVVLLGIFPPIKPREVHNFSCAIRKVCNNTLFAGTHLEGLETEDMSFNLYKWHVAIQFADAVKTTAIHMFIRKILQQLTIRHDAQFFAEHLFP